MKAEEMFNKLGYHLADSNTDDIIYYNDGNDAHNAYNVAIIIRFHSDGEVTLEADATMGDSEKISGLVKNPDLIKAVQKQIKELGYDSHRR